MKNVNSYEVKNTASYNVFLNANENNYPLNEGEIVDVLLSLKECDFNRYPETTSYKLREKYGEIMSVSPNNILAGNGSDALLGLVISSYIQKGKKIVTLNPDFSMYDFYASINEGEIRKFHTRKDGSFSVKEFSNFIKDENPELVVFSNPNNPTGHYVAIKEIKKILSTFPKTKVLVDEAYIDFGGESMIPFFNDYSNLIITRTLSKAWGLAALRVGFLIAGDKIINELKPFMIPFNLSSLSQGVAEGILSYEVNIYEVVEKIIEERERVFIKYKEIEKKSNRAIIFYKSKANFIFGRSIYINNLKEALDSKGILIRYFDDNSFRITIGKREEDDLVIEVLRDFFDKREENYSEKGAS